jgi:hypothetical protein
MTVADKGMASAEKLASWRQPRLGYRMRQPLLLLIALPILSCMQIGTDTGAGSGGGSLVSAGEGSADAGPGGTNCAQDPTSQIVLCEQIDTCPGVDVDPGAFPNCGFRLRDVASLDIECLCGDSLCPVGVPTTCGEAQALLDGQNALLVCQQQAEGRCLEMVTPDAGVSSCDTVCRDECAGTPSCLQLCGC